jgi:hypothetical protein
MMKVLKKDDKLSENVPKLNRIKITLKRIL